jgi:hypothetical protein
VSSESQVTEHAASAVVGKGELAEFRVIGARFGHLGVTFGRGIFATESAEDAETGERGTGLAEKRVEELRRSLRATWADKGGLRLPIPGPPNRNTMSITRN